MPKRHLVSFTDKGQLCPKDTSKLKKFPECDLIIRDIADKPFQPVKPPYQPIPVTPIPPPTPPLPPFPPRPINPNIPQPTRKTALIAPVRRKQLTRIAEDLVDARRSRLLRERGFQQLTDEDLDAPFKRRIDVDPQKVKVKPKQIDDAGGTELVDITPNKRHDANIQDTANQFDIQFGTDTPRPNPNELRILNTFETQFRQANTVIDRVLNEIARTGQLTPENLADLFIALSERTVVANAYATGDYGVIEDANLRSLMESAEHSQIFDEADVILQLGNIDRDNPHYKQLEKLIKESAIRSSPPSYTDAQKRAVLSESDAMLLQLEPDIENPKAPLKPKEYVGDIKAVDIRRQASRSTKRYKDNQEFLKLKNKFGKLPVGVRNQLLPDEYKSLTDSVIADYIDRKGLDRTKTLKQRDKDAIRRIVEDLVIDIQQLDYGDLEGLDFVSFRENIESKINNYNRRTQYAQRTAERTGFEVAEPRVRPRRSTTSNRALRYSALPEPPDIELAPLIRPNTDNLIQSRLPPPPDAPRTIDMSKYATETDIDFKTARPDVTLPKTKLTMTDRINIARQNVSGRDLAISGTGAVTGLAVGMGVSELLQENTDIGVYGNTAISGFAGEATGFLAEQAIVRATSGAAGRVTARSTMNLLAGATASGLAGAGIGLALLPADIALNKVLYNATGSYRDANTYSSAVIGTGALLATGAVSLALAPATLGTSLVIGALATAATTLWGYFQGAEQDKRVREEQAERERQQREYEEAVIEYNSEKARLNNLQLSRTGFLRTLADPTVNYDFDKALQKWEADGKNPADLIGRDEAEYKQWASTTRHIFSNNFHRSLAEEGVEITHPEYTDEEIYLNDAYAQYVQYNLIERICKETEGECNAELRQQQPPPLTADQIFALNNASDGLWYATALTNIEQSYQEIQSYRNRVTTAQNQMLDYWDAYNLDMRNIDQFDDIVATAFLDELFEANFETAITQSAQNQVIDAYVNEQTKIRDLDEGIQRAALQDPEFRNNIEQYYIAQEQTASALGVTIPQLIELQKLEDGSDEQRELYQQHITENSGTDDNYYTNVENDRRELQEINAQYTQLVGNLNAMNQQQIDAYNTNLLAELNQIQQDYYSAVDNINQQIKYEGRTDILTFNTQDAFDKYKLDYTDYGSARPQPQQQQQVNFNLIREYYGISDADFKQLKNQAIENNITQLNNEDIQGIGETYGTKNQGTLPAQATQQDAPPVNVPQPAEDPPPPEQEDSPPPVPSV